MKVRLSYVAELVLILGVGMALARACREGQPVGFYGPRQVVEPFLVGVAATGAIMLGWETLRRPSERAWGIGRWTWWVTGLCALIDLSINLIHSCCNFWMRGKIVSVDSLLRTTRGACTSQFYGGVSWILAATWVASRISGVLRDTGPDGREVAGRILLVLVVLWSLLFRMYNIVNLR
jgi:hypothetical protein